MTKNLRKKQNLAISLSKMVTLVYHSVTLAGVNVTGNVANVAQIRSSFVIFRFGFVAFVSTKFLIRLISGLFGRPYLMAGSNFVRGS